MAFWATTWEKPASAEASEAEQAKLRDDVVNLQTQIGNRDTGGTLVHDVGLLQRMQALKLDGRVITVTGTLPDLVRQDVVLARFSEENNLFNGKIQYLGLWIEREEGEWFHADSAQLHHDWGWRFHIFWRGAGTSLLSWYTTVPRVVTSRWGTFGNNWRRNYRLYYLEFPHICRPSSQL